MTAAKLVDVYRCPACDKPWLDEWDMHHCCDVSRGVAWACGNDRCPNDGLHETESDANECGNPHECECGHMERVHALQGQWAGCYDLDCRCTAYAPVKVEAL